MKKIIAITPIKYNSQRFKNKNFQLLGTYPLYYYATQKVFELSSIIKKHAKMIPCIYCDHKTFVNLDDLTKSLYRWVVEKDTPVGQDGNQLFKKMALACQHENPDYLFIFNITSPFVNVSTYHKVIKTVLDNEDSYDSACTVVSLHGRMWQLGNIGNSIPFNHDPSKCQRTQNQKPIYFESEACWLIKPSLIINHTRRVGYCPSFIEVNGSEAIDINYQTDLSFAKMFLKAFEL